MFLAVRKFIILKWFQGADLTSDEKKVEFGVLTHFCYEIEGTGERIEIATTRPETMLGDTGIAVHPDGTLIHLGNIRHFTHMAIQTRGTSTLLARTPNIHSSTVSFLSLQIQLLPWTLVLVPSS